MHILSILFLLVSFSLFAQEAQDEVDYTSFSLELSFVEEAAKEAINKEEQKLLDNVDKISEEKVETPAHTLADEQIDRVSTTSAAVEKTAPVIRPPVEKKRRVRSR